MVEGEGSVPELLRIVELLTAGWPPLASAHLFGGSPGRDVGSVGKSSPASPVPLSLAFLLKARLQMTWPCLL